MNEMMHSTMFWVGLVLFASVAVVAIEYILRGMSNRLTAGNYPHRVANELPRTLHKGDHDEVLELRGE